MNKIHVGERYGRLVVLENHHPKDEVLCICDCGKLKTARASNVFYGGTRSCGCKFSEGNNRKHGDRHTRLYGIWKGMNERCNTKSCSTYKNYGARGICVCKEWREYTVFKEWALSNGYSDDLTIDRIDVNGNYEPNNCRFATTKEQANNKRSNRYITYNGETKTLMEWSEIFGIKYATLWARLKSGWTFEAAKERTHGWKA